MRNLAKVNKKAAPAKRAAFPIEFSRLLSAKVIVHDGGGINAQVVQHSGNGL